MLNIFLSVSDVKKGFAATYACHRLRCVKVANFEDALNDCIDQFDAFSQRLPDSHLLRFYRREIIETMATLEHANDIGTAVDTGERAIINVVASDEI